MQLSNDLQRVLYNYTPSNILFMAAPRSRCGHYIFALWFLSSIGSRPSDHHFRSVCWFVCLFDCAEFFFSRLWSDFHQTRTYVICLGL